MAFAMAGAVGTSAYSAVPEAPKGPFFLGILSVITSILGISLALGTLNLAKPSVFVIDCSAIFDIEYTALKMLTEAEERLERDGITLWLAALNPNVFAAVSRSKLGEKLGRARMFFNLQAAVERYQQAKPAPTRGQGAA